MAKTSKIKTSAAPHCVPQNRESVVSMIARIGTHQRDRQRIKADMDDQITALRESYDTQLVVHSQAIQALTEGVHIWCEANREALTGGNKVKFANLMTGEVKWRLRPTSCRAIKVKEAIEEIKLNGLAATMLRLKEELNKEAILANPEAVAGFRWIALEQGEDFVIVPFETDLEEVA
jgi:phage host-nuclease inhibitor protein Gam